MTPSTRDSIHIVKRPLVTEKGTWEAQHLRVRGKATGLPLNRYSFLVDINATRTQIKDAIQDLYKVRVLKVRTQVRKGVYFRNKFGQARTPDWKKATVQIHAEDSIDLF
ncbi:MAG: 50S ribosomal protein L23 [Phycisphaeraceae bacterium]